MGFHVQVPAVPMDALIETIWDWDMPQQPHRLERVLPCAGAALIINLHEDETRTYADDGSGRCTRAAAAVLGGPATTSQIIDTAEQVRVMGVVFRPGGVCGFSAEDMTATAGREVDLHDLFGPGAGQLRQHLLDTPTASRRIALLEQWLRARLRGTGIHPAVSHAVTLLERAPQVLGIARVARECGWSERRLLTVFRRQVGLTPKQFARLARFRAVIAQVHPARTVDWTAVALDSGYGDQAHLCHEFRRFAGVTPSAFMAQRGPYPNHLALD